MVSVSPSLFTIPLEDLAAKVQAVNTANFLHIDVTDGEFVRDASGGASLFWDENHLETAQTASSVPLDIHLMIADPQKHIERYARFRPAFLTFHYEAAGNPRAVIEEIRRQGVSPAVALNPSTPLFAVKPLLDQVAMVLLMSVVPGKGGQGYLSEVTEKIAELRRTIDQQGLKTLIEVDGGVKLENAYLPTCAGADVLVSGTGVYNHPELSPGQVMEKMRSVLVFGSDHGGYDLKRELLSHLHAKKIAHRDLGCFGTESVDYPDYADKVAKGILSREYQRGILLCGTGIGISMRANRYSGIRAAVCRAEYDARMSREHNDANILVLGGRTTTPALAESIFDTWYKTSFSGEEKHRRRIGMLDQPLNS